MSEILDVDQVRAMATPAGALWAGEQAPTALALARTALEWFARWSTVHAAEEARDLAIVERDEAYRQRDAAQAAAKAYGIVIDDTRAILGAIDDETLTAAAERVMARFALLLQERDIVRHDADKARAELADARAVVAASEAALAEARRERDEARSRIGEIVEQRTEARQDVANYERQINDARAILGAAAGDLLSDAAERAACAVQHEANAMDIIGRALGLKVVGGADVAAIHASEEIDRLRERVKALVGAERERDRLLRSESEVCKILGAAPDELLSDAAERTICQRDAARDNLALIRDTLNPPADVSVLDAADWYRREVEALRERVCAEAEPPQVFRPPISVTVRHACDRPFAEVVVGAIQDPAFLALPMGVRLGLVVCDG